MESGAAEGGHAGGRRAAGGGGAPERKRSKAKEVTVSLGRSIEYVNNSTSRIALNPTYYLTSIILLDSISEVHSSKLNRYCLGPKKVSGVIINDHFVIFSITHPN